MFAVTTQMGTGNGPEYLQGNVMSLGLQATNKPPISLVTAVIVGDDEAMVAA
jgi:hypothetical protein